MKKPKLVPDWRQSWKWFSTQAMALAVAIQGAWMFIPEDMKESLPKDLVGYATMALLVLGVAGRLVNQDAGTNNSK
jgi:hypothetical protein